MSGEAEMAKAGFDALMGLSNGWLAGQQIKAQNKIDQANAVAANLMRGANNELAASRASLSRYVQNVNNQRTADAAGADLEAAITNYQRARDGQVEEDFESQIAAAEQAGAQAAAGAASGLVGGVVDVVNSTTAIRQMRAQQRRATAVNQFAYDAKQQRADHYRSTLEGMDQSDITADIDFSIDTYSPKVRAGNWWTDMNAGSAGVQASVAAADKFYFKSATAAKYKTDLGSQQTRMLAEQDSWFD